MTAGRFTALARIVGAIVDDAELVAGIDELAGMWRAALTEERGRRLRGRLDGDPARVLSLARSRLDPAMAALRKVPDEGAGDVGARKIRAMQALTSLIDDIDAVQEVRVDEVSWVEGTEENPVLRVAPVDVGELLAEQLWPTATAVLTSATLPAALPDQVGLPAGGFQRLDVGSPFDYPTQALLYCAAHLPDPRSAAFDPAVHDELEALIGAAGGRTMALFTSYRALQAAVEALRPRLTGRGPRPGRPAQAGAGGALRRRAGDLPVRHHGLLAGRRRPRRHAHPRHHRPPAVPPARRPAAAGPP